MRRVGIDKLKKDMVLAKPIYTSNGVILLKEGTLLTEKFLEKIHDIDVDYIYIKDELSEGIEIEALISEKTVLSTKKALEDSMEKMRKGYFTASQSIVEKVDAVISEVVANPHVMVSLQEIRSRDEYLHMHSINVCVISLLIGKKLNYNDAQLKHLALGAILHDVGKTQIKYDVIRYREDYVDKEYKIYKEHVRLGYEMIKSIPESSLLAANIALTHHEHYDGTGFPLGKKNTSIHEFSRIVAVANEYDNLLYNLPKDTHIRHYEIVEMIVSRAYTWFDPEIIKIFRKSISPYPVSTGVVLNDGRIGIVARLNEDFPTRPVIRIIDETSMAVMGEVDLSVSLNTLIVDEKEIDK